MMLIFTILGLVAGVKVMIKTAQELQDENMAQSSDAQDESEGK